MVNGNLVVENRRHTKADEVEILEKSRRWAEKIRSK
jgi:hypothetical protein